MSSFIFSKISIIQALDPGEFEFGTELGKYIDGLRDDRPTVPKVELINLKGRDEFLQAIDKLVKEAERNDDCRILQIEMHGREDKSGLALPPDVVRTMLRARNRFINGLQKLKQPTLLAAFKVGEAARTKDRGKEMEEFDTMVRRWSYL